MLGDVNIGFIVEKEKAFVFHSLWGLRLIMLPVDGKGLISEVISIDVYEGRYGAWIP